MNISQRLYSLPVFFSISLSKNERVENAQQVPERFWSLMLVIGNSLIVVNTGFLLSAESFFSASCACAPRANDASSANVNNFFISLILVYFPAKVHILI